MELFKVILIMFFPFLAFVNNLPKDLFKEISLCREVLFTQKTIFEDSVETYEGVLKISKQQKEIIYFTEPPFVVIQTGKLLKMGYEGEEFQTFEVDEYPNPILAILLHFNNLSKVFKIKGCDQQSCILVPKPPLNDYLEKVEVFFSNGKIEKVEAYGGELGTVIIKILNLKGCFKPRDK